LAHAYTPGLKVTKSILLRKERRLPLPGQVLVKEGDWVKAEDIVAKTELPGNAQPVNVAGFLSAPPEDVPSLMKKKVGEKVKKGDIIAESKGIFGLFRSKVESPCDGTIESISEITGQVIIREPPIPVQVNAYIDGKVVKLIENEGVVVETTASFVQGIFGIGGERIGFIKVLVQSPDEELKAEKIDKNAKGAIIVGGSFVSYEALKRAEEVGAVGVVAGGIDDRNLRRYLGYDIGVAITGREPVKTTLVITEGFGKMAMARRTFELLRELDGKKASINGATQIRAGVIRPEIIVPLNPAEGKETEKEEETLKEGLVEGSLVRVIREPYFGKIGKVVSLPPQLVEIETEAKVRILELELEDGKRVVIPRANVEIIEE